MPKLKTQGRTEAEHNIGLENPENNTIKVFSQGNHIVINGAEAGANVFSTSGVRLRSIVPSDDMVKIRLPGDQIYIIKVGQDSYKVCL